MTAVGEALAKSNKRKWPSMNALLDVALGRNLENFWNQRDLLYLKIKLKVL